MGRGTRPGFGPGAGGHRGRRQGSRRHGGKTLHRLATCHFSRHGCFSFT